MREYEIFEKEISGLGLNLGDIAVCVSSSSALEMQKHEEDIAESGSDSGQAVGFS